MCYNYYEPPNTELTEKGTKKFNFGDLDIELASTNFPFEGMLVRELVTEQTGGSGSKKVVTHLQETMWPDNKPPGSTV